MQIVAQQQGQAPDEQPQLTLLEKAILQAFFDLRGSLPLTAVGDFYFRGVPRNESLPLILDGLKLSVAAGDICMLLPGVAHREYGVVDQTGKVVDIFTFRRLSTLIAQRITTKWGSQDPDLFLREFRALLLSKMAPADAALYASIPFKEWKNVGRSSAPPIHSIVDSNAQATRRLSTAREQPMAVAS